MRVFVISIQRTGSTAVLNSLRSAGIEAWRLHHLTLPQHWSTEQIAAKRVKHEFVRSKLSEAEPKAVFTIQRDTVDRRLSGVWYERHADLIADRTIDGFGRDAEEVLARKCRTMAWAERQFAREVYVPLGLPERPQPGRYELADGAPAYVLRFDHLADDFSVATREVVGRALELERQNSADERHPDYQTFRAWALREFAGTGFLELE